MRLDELEASMRDRIKNFNPKKMDRGLKICYHGYDGMVCLFLQHGADPEAENRKGETSASIANKYRMKKILKIPRKGPTGKDREE